MSPEPIIITASMLRWLKTCERRVWLDAHNDVSLREALSPAVLQRLHEGVEHEEDVHAATAPRMESIPVRDWSQGVELTRQAMQEGMKTILGAHLEASLELDGVPIIVRGKIDRLVRVHRLIHVMKHPQKMVYAPVEIKQYLQLDEADSLQLDCYIWLLKQTQQVEPPTAEFWLGKDEYGVPVHRIQHEYDEDRFLNTLSRMVYLISQQTDAPPVRLAEHCKGCGWHSACKTQAKVHYDVSLLNGLRSETHTHFKLASITSMHQVAAMTVDELRKFKGIGRVTAETMQLQARAYVEQRPMWLEQLNEICKRPMWFFDIETDPYTGNVWSIGWADHDRNLGLLIVTPHQSKTRHITLPDGRVVALVPDTNAAWRYFAQAMSPNGNPVAHWTGFDAGVMRKSAPQDVIDSLDDRLHDLHHTFKRTVQIPASGTSLKTVSAYLGFHYEGYQDWSMAYNDYRRWLATDEDEHLARACAYQADDVIAMIVVWKWLNEQQTIY
jgi:predicted RecB family nuclease